MITVFLRVSQLFALDSDVISHHSKIYDVIVRKAKYPT